MPGGVHVCRAALTRFGVRPPLVDLPYFLAEEKQKQDSAPN
jgi:hypothetical protein